MKGKQYGDVFTVTARTLVTTTKSKHGPVDGELSSDQGLRG